MKKFYLIYHANASARKIMSKSKPEDMKKSMEPWFAWKKKIGSKLLDMGSPLGNTHRISTTEHGAISSSVVGYSIIKALNLSDVRKMLVKHPHIVWNKGCSIEIHEVLPLPGQK